jgi:hypothetical protein
MEWPLRNVLVSVDEHDVAMPAFLVPPSLRSESKISSTCGVLPRSVHYEISNGKAYGCLGDFAKMETTGPSR